MGRRRHLDLASSEELDRFFDHLDRLNQDDLLRMKAAWRSIDHQAHEAAWKAVRAVGSLWGLEEEIEKIRNRALAWVAYDGAPYRVLDSNPMWLQCKMEAAAPIVDAAIGVGLGERLDPTTRATLLVAWAGPAPR